MKRATCTWGDGPDVLLVFEDDHFMLYEDPKYNKPPQGSPAHGYVTKGSSDLTADEALQLAADLEAAANNAKELDRTCEEHDEEAANQAKAFEIFKEIAVEYDYYEKRCKMPNVPMYIDEPLSEKDLMAILADHPPETLTCYRCAQRDTCKYVDDLYNIDGDCLADK